MDSTDDITYLNYLSDKSDNYLLEGSDDALGGVQDPTLSGEAIFGDLDDGNHAWTIDGLPVLLNGPIITDDQMVNRSIDLESQKIILPKLQENQTDLPASNIDSSEESPMSYPIEISGSNYATSNELFLPNEILLQLNFENETSDVVEYNGGDQTNEAVLTDANDGIYNLNYETGNDDLQCDSTIETNEEVQFTENNQLINLSNLSNSGEVIQLLNIDGSIININKNLLNVNIQTVPANENESNSDIVNFHEMVETVEAFKCKNCVFLSLSVVDMTNHIKGNNCVKGEPDNVRMEYENEPPVTKSAPVSVLNSKQPNQTNRQLVYLCSECDLGYGTTTELKEHMMKKHKLENENVEPKSKTEEKKPSEETENGNLRTAKNQHKASKKVKCSIKGCEARFALDEFRIRHEKCHVNGEKKQFKCPVCEIQFSIWRVCSLHMWKCHSIDIGMLTCTLCNNFKTLSPYKLMSHMEVHNEIKQYLCSECGKRFSQITQLRNHEVTHLKNGEDIPAWFAQRKCDICSNYFADSKTLKKHVQGVHNKFKPYVCNICGHKSSRKAMLNLHLRQHTGEKPYQCTLCEYRTGDHNSLRRHHMRHNGSTKYSCPHCHYQSIQSVTYKAHISTKHPGLNGFFWCKHCSFGTVNENTYNTHVKKHDQDLLKVNVQIEQPTSVLDKNKILWVIETTPLPTETVDKEMDVEDEETEHGFLSVHTDETVDNGGITIPAGLELQAQVTAE